MARNEEHTMRFLAKVLWKYRGTVKFREVMIRLLEFDCIRRNYSKGTLYNLLQQFRAWYKDPECKMAKKLPTSYRKFLEELKQADAEGLECSIEEPIVEEQPPEEPPVEEAMAPAEEPPIVEQIIVVTIAKAELEEKYNTFIKSIDDQIEKLEHQKETARYLYNEKNSEYSAVLRCLERQEVWNDMMK